jgi:chromosome segregation ATPase
MFDHDNSDYTRFYVKRQELLLFEQIKKSIDLEVKVTMLTSLLEDLRKEYNETYSKLQQQIDITNQAANGVQDLTNKNNFLENTIKELKENVETMQNKLIESNTKMSEVVANKEKVSSELEFCFKKTDELERELVRQQKEMQEIFEENKSLQSKKTINKKTPVVTDSDF